MMPVSGVQEDVSGSVEERQKNDEKTAEDILNCIGASFCIQSVKRLGKLSSTSRPIRVVLSDYSQNQQILKKAKSLRSSADYKNVYINIDRTIMQQREAKFLRDELKRRTANGENDLVIYGGKVIPKEDIKNFQLRF